MGDLISIDTARRERTTTESEAWSAYLAARTKAEASQAIEDGVAAGKAWARWLALFERAC